MPETQHHSISDSQADTGDAFPFISVVIPVLNEERYLPRCLEGLLNQQYPKTRYEIIFADGGSTDRSRELIEAAGCRVIANPGRTVLCGRNEGFAAAQGEIIAFTDADCLFPPDWLQRAARYFEQPDVAGISGPTEVPDDQNRFGKAVGVFFDLAAGLGVTVHLRSIQNMYETDDLPGCNAFYRKAALARVLPMQDRLGTNEDVAMNRLLLQYGCRLFMTPDVRLQHYKRTGPAGFFKQMYRFAHYRLILSRQHLACLKPGHYLAGIVFPVAALGGLVSGVFVPWVYPAGAGLLAITALAFSVLICQRYGCRLLLPTWLALTTGATGWICGFWHAVLISASPGSRDHHPAQQQETS